ncbi:MAG: metalloregulator ArsR/SmtB family transcription factor, partial [Chloroflexi bacterium]|nr:metalloregulator ArsR/SmtB family transcription factor [Chloroflexota bacterium]
VVLDVRTAYDFLLSLVPEPDAEPLPADREWLERSLEGLSAGVRRDLRLVFGREEHKGVGLALVPLIVERPEVRTAADVVALATSLSPADLIRPFCCELDPAIGDLVDRIAAGERDLVPEVLGQIEEPEVREEVAGFLADPTGHQRAIVRVLRAWREQYEKIESRVGRFIERDAADRRADLAALDPFEFIERTSGGVRWAPQPNLDRVVLAPSYFARPYNMLFAGRAWRMLCYPIADTALESDASMVPAATIRLFRALGDDSRLRILRHLADGDLYLTEIAERMALSKPTVSHHLAQLRAAGLVTISEMGGMTYYTLRRDRLAGVDEGLRRYLGIAGA